MPGVTFSSEVPLQRRGPHSSEVFSQNTSRPFLVKFRGHRRFGSVFLSLCCKLTILWDDFHWLEEPLRVTRAPPLPSRGVLTSGSQRASPEATRLTWDCLKTAPTTPFFLFAGVSSWPQTTQLSACPHSALWVLVFRSVFCGLESSFSYDLL